MDFFFLSVFQDRFRKDESFYPAFFWIVGLITGLLVSSSAADHLAFFLEFSLDMPASIGGLLPAMLLPLFLSAASVLLRCRGLVYGVAFLKAFLFSYHTFAISLCFGEAGWLLCLLLFFSDAVSSVVLWMFWLEVLRSGTRDLAYRVIPAFAAVFLICSIDCSLISPFLGAVLS